MKITVFTPTYDRAYILGQAYESLKSQTDKDFLWLIIDDGSTDNTEELIKKWIYEKQINIQYIKQENSGKHIAHNTAVENCETEYFLILDSDDYLNERTIEILNKEVDKISNMNQISGIIGNKFNAQTKECIGTKIIEKVEYVSGVELYQKYKHKGDTLRLYKTNILKQFLFPKIEGEKFMYENVVFDQIDNKYKMLINRDELYYCKYLDDGYTNNEMKLKKNNPIGYIISLSSSIKYSIKLINKMKWTILLVIWSKILKVKAFKYSNNKLLYCFLYLVAYIFYILKIPKQIFIKLSKYEEMEKNEGRIS